MSYLLHENIADKTFRIFIAKDNGYLYTAQRGTTNIMQSGNLK